MNRRDFLSIGVKSAVGAGLLLKAPSLWADALDAERKLALYNLHTQESINLVYWSQGQYIDENLQAIYHVLRDYRTGTQANIDLRVLDYLYSVATRLDLREPFQIISGFRSQKTNEMLHRIDGKGVAQNSLHTRGMAVDVKLQRTSLDNLHKAARTTRRGGVGFYPGRFVHLDVGPVRHWQNVRKTKSA